MNPLQINATIPTPVADIVMRCLAKSPAERFARANDVADALIAWLGTVENAVDPMRKAWAAQQVVRAVK